MRYFVMAAEEKNISRAAARLNISQPAVSRQIRDLEEELGAVLFERERNGLSLTEAGHTALGHARQMLRQEKALGEAMRFFVENEGLASLKVGFIPTALTGFLAEALRLFNQKQSRVCVQIYEMSPRQQEKALRKGDIDLALFALGSIPRSLLRL
ncbi:MAG: LysR family transcriptional regulator [Verrucomicrobia bacterium]|nr:LysR family transcriptional regulator [Verrucomicrobiota bacterium]